MLNVCCKQAACKQHSFFLFFFVFSSGLCKNNNFQESVGSMTATMHGRGSCCFLWKTYIALGQDFSGTFLVDLLSWIVGCVSCRWCGMLSQRNQPYCRNCKRPTQYSPFHGVLTQHFYHNIDPPFGFVVIRYYLLFGCFCCIDFSHHVHRW